MVPGGGIEPPTRGFSIRCSTPELPGHLDQTIGPVRGYLPLRNSKNCGGSSAGIVTLNQPVHMNLSQSGRKLLGVSIMVIVSPISTIGNAVRTVQPGTQVEIRAAFAAKRIGCALAGLVALRTGYLRAQRRDAGGW